MEEYKKKTGIDAEHLDAVGWLARGAEMPGRKDKAADFVAEVRKEIREEKPDTIIPLGAAIRLLEAELSRARDISLRSRIQKNLNLLTLGGQKAPSVKVDLGGHPHSSSSGPMDVVTAKPRPPS